MIALALAAGLTTSCRDASGRRSFERGLELVEAADPAKQKEGLRILLQLGEAGDLRAQTKLGTLYHRGHVVREDLAEAYRWYAKAAAQGDRNATVLRDGMARLLTEEQRKQVGIQ
jgi:TPR repeat protein